MPARRVAHLTGCFGEKAPVSALYIGVVSNPHTLSMGVLLCTFHAHEVVALSLKISFRPSETELTWIDL